MKRISVFLILLLVLTIVLGSCGRSGEAPSVEPPQMPTETPTPPTETSPLPTETPTSSPWLTIYLPIPREINQSNYSQIVESLTVSSNILPSEVKTVSGEYDNIFKAVSWDKEQTGEISATLETIISRKVEMSPVTTSDSYPIPQDLLPNDIKIYLQPSPWAQSDHPAIAALAQTLSQGLTKEVDVVTKTLEWISQNVKWGCPKDIENPAPDAVWTLEHREGNCVNFANLTIALLRAQRIPARYVLGFKGYEDSNPGYLKPVDGSDWHVWTEVYYPEVGWVRYDATYFPHPWHIPYGIQLSVVPDGSRSPGYCLWSSEARGEASESWQLMGLSVSRIKLTYTITFSVKE